MNLKKEWFIVLIVLIGAVLRLYNLPNTVQFLGDQGRDALIVADIFKKGDLVFIGPVTSVGNMYLGPLYYYFMVPFLWLTYPSPLGPVYAIALLGVITVALMYYLGRELIGGRAALFATILYALSVTVIIHARFSWNPNPAPLVSLILVWALFRALTRNPWYWVVVATCFAVLIQLHYLTLLAGVTCGLIWGVKVGLQLYQKNFKDLALVSKATVVGVLVILLSLIPLLLFDYKHDWLNAKAFSELFASEENFKHSSSLQRLTTALLETHGRSMHILFEISIGKMRRLNTLLVGLCVAVFAWIIATRKRRPHFVGEAILITFFAIGVIGTSFYEHTVFDHYIAYLFPVTFLLLGVVAAQALRVKVIGPLALTIFFVYYLSYNIPLYPLRNTGWKVSDIERTSNSISDRVKPGEKYNIVLLSETGDIDGQNYRYFLSTTATPPVPLEERGSVETLFIINEDRVLNKVIDSPVYEIVVFPDKQPREVYTIPGGPEITVLRKE